MQIGYIHQLIQARLVDNPESLSEVYNCLHYFCQSLQLEVLFSQTMHLKQHRLNESVQVEEYVRGSKLVVSYWRYVIVYVCLFLKLTSCFEESFLEKILVLSWGID